MKGVLARMRIEWIRTKLGKNRKFTVKQFEKVQRRTAEQGWAMAAPADGPALEKVVAVHEDHPAFGVVQSYQKGIRWFGINRLNRTVNTSIICRTGAFRLAMLGFAMVRISGDRVEIRVADPRAARLVNLSRLGSQVCGFSARRLVEAFLHIRPPERSRINLTDDRRLYTAEILTEHWFIECDDLLIGRMRVRLDSTWTFNEPNKFSGYEYTANVSLA